MNNHKGEIKMQIPTIKFLSHHNQNCSICDTIIVKNRRIFEKNAKKMQILTKKLGYFDFIL